MKIIGIICEYNPLHNGHIKQLNFTKKLVKKDGFVLCVMSGNFTQRAEPSVLEKSVRAKHAILSGADAVLELPALYATDSAANFAYGAVSILNAIKADGICCGSESGQPDKLKQFSKDIRNNPLFDKAVQQQMKEGINYPAAVSNAAKELFNCDLLDKPNNLLAVEYLNAMDKFNPNMEFFTLKREEDYRQTDIAKSVSASAVRKCLYENKLAHAKPALPNFVYDDLVKADKNILDKYRCFLPMFLSSLSTEYLNTIEGVTEGIENRILSCLSPNFDKFILKLKTKRYTRLKLNRIFFNSILGITKGYADIKQSLPPIKILALKKDSGVLTEVAKRTDILTRKKTPQQIICDDITTRADRFYGILSNNIKDKNLANKILKV